MSARANCFSKPCGNLFAHAAHVVLKRQAAPRRDCQTNRKMSSTTNLVLFIVVIHKQKVVDH